LILCTNCVPSSLNTSSILFRINFSSLRVSFASLLLLGAAIAAPIHDLNRRSKQEDYDTSVSGQLVPILSRAFVVPKVPVVPKPIVAPKPPLPHPIEPPAAPVRLDPLDPVEPVKASGSPDAPPKPDTSEAPARLTGDAPPKAPMEKPAG
jgi:hypothetical protein